MACFRGKSSDQFCAPCALPYCCQTLSSTSTKQGKLRKCFVSLPSPKLLSFAYNQEFLCLFSLIVGERTNVHLVSFHLFSSKHVMIAADE